MNKLPEYSNYTSTNIDWIRKYPSHWQLIPCRAVVDHIVEKNEGGKIQNYLSLMANVGVIRYEDKGDIGNKKPEDLSKCKIVKKGQLVINSMNYSIGSYGMSSYNGVCSSVYIILEPKNNLLNRYGLRVFENSAFQKHLATFGNGILAHRAAIGWDDIKGEYIPLAPKDEQEKILNFLDYETAQIDTLIDKQQTLIKLLKEKRQAVISHAVTKGLNPDAPMKDSGVEWLGEVPEHWDLTRIKYITSVFEQGWSPQCDSRPAEENEYGVLKVGCVNHGKFNVKENKALPPELSPKLQYLIYKNDLLISRANTKELVGSAAVVDDDYDNILLCDKLYRLRFIPEINPRLVSFYLSIGAVREQIELQASGASHSMQNISQDVIKEMPCFFLSKEESKSILAFIDKQTEVFDSLINNAQKAIQLMQERRTALISAAVTGKIDVRGWRASE